MRSVLLRAVGALACLWLVATPALALDLQEALARAAAAHPLLAARAARVEASRARVAPAAAWPAPMLEVGALNVPPGGRLDMDPMAMTMVGLSQRLPLAGTLGLARRSATAALASEHANATQAHFDVMAATWQAYTGAYFAEQRARDAEAHRDEMDQLVRTARSRYETGAGRLDDVLRAQADQARTLAERAEMEADAIAARARLDALMGDPPGAPVARAAATTALGGGHAPHGSAAPESLAAPPDVEVPPDPAAWLARLDDEHPALLARKAEADRWRLAGREMRRMLWPDLQLSVSYGMRRDVMGMPLDNMWSGTLGLMLPLFGRQRELSLAAEMDAMARASEAERRATQLELSQRLVAAHARARSAQRRERLFADTVRVARRQALESAWSGYTVGTSDLGRVLDAMHELYVDELALSAARQDRRNAEGELIAIAARRDFVDPPLPGPTGAIDAKGAQR